MGLKLRNRLMMILALLIAGSTLATVVTWYLEEPPMTHHVTTGKVGTNPDGTFWVAEFIRGRVVFNYTLPRSSVHSRFLYYESVSIVAVPLYSQGFELERTEEGQYAVHIPIRRATVLVSNLEAYQRQYEDTVLLEAYALFSRSVSDVRVLSKIHDSEFAVNGVVTFIHDDGTTTISGYVLTVDGKHYAVTMDLKESIVKEVREIKFEYK